MLSVPPIIGSVFDFDFVVVIGYPHDNDKA